MTRSLIALTVTGDRPECFKLCRQWIKQQQRHFKRKLPLDRWIIVDDSRIPYLNMKHEPFPIKQEILYPKYDPNLQNTQRRNLLFACEYIKTLPDYERALIIIVEDDDWIHCRYFEWLMCMAKQGYSFLGESRSWYYHVQTCSYRKLPNSRSAGLYQTAFLGRWIHLLEMACKNEKPNYFDVQLWRRYVANHVPPGEILLASSSQLTLGIKGMPGRPGIGVGHNLRIGNWKKDKKLHWLRSYIGKEDFEWYWPYLGPNSFDFRSKKKESEEANSESNISCNSDR